MSVAVVVIMAVLAGLAPVLVTLYTSPHCQGPAGTLTAILLPEEFLKEGLGVRLEDPSYQNSRA